MFSKKKRIIALSIALLMSLTLLAACGSKDSGSTTPPPASSGSSSSSSSTPEASSGGDNILRFGTTGVAGNFNPIMANNVYDAYVMDLVFDFLVKNDAKGEYKGDIADFTISDDFLTYTFKLKDGITFSDGTPMTSADVEFTYKTIAHPDYNGPRGYAVADLVGYEEYHAGETDVFEGIKVIDGKTVSFTFGDGLASPANIECFVYGIMPMHYYDFNSWDDFLDLLQVPLGSGKFVFNDFRLKEYVMLDVNTNYWDTAKTPKIDGILMSEIPEESLMDAFSTGQLDLAQPQTNLDNYNGYNAMEGVVLNPRMGNGYTYLCFNTVRATVNDVKVRQALMYALDRKSFIEAVYGPLASVGLAPISPVSWAFPDSGLNDYAFNMAKAAELMDEAGWTKGSDGILQKNGVRMSLIWLVYTDVEWPGRLAEMAYDSWRDLGVELDIQLYDFDTVIERTMDAPLEDRDFDIYTMGWSLSIDPDPTGALFDYDAYVVGGFNASGYFNQESQDLIRDGKTEFDQAKRAAIYKKWALLVNEEIPTIVVAYRNEIWVYNERVNNMIITPYEDWTMCISDVVLD